MTTVLDPQRRGDEFRYTFTIGNSWTSSNFTGGLWFTLRTTQPASDVTDDTDAGVVEQGSVAGGQITFSTSTTGTVLFTGAQTTDWPSGRLYWDLQGVVTVGARVLTLDEGTILITKDITRRTS